MDSFLIAIGSLLPLLVVLVVVHEFGHFATARAMGVKVLEFGIGFPPRAFGIYTGRTPVLTDSATLFAGLPGPQAIQPGMRLKVSSAEDADGNLLAKRVEAAGGPREHETDDEPRFDDEDLLKHEGKVRAVAPGSFILADMLYSVNLMPLGGFVRLAGESNPNVPRSLASKGAGAPLAGAGRRAVHERHPPHRHIHHTAHDSPGSCRRSPHGFRGRSRHGRRRFPNTGRRHHTGG